jgi:glutamate formiminotransferase
MNLTDFHETSMHQVFDAVGDEAEREGVEIAGSEIIGLVPNEAISITEAAYLKVENFRPDMILENRLAQAT